jgi:hypothetical protein
MNESTRGLIYRGFLIAAVVFLAFTRPDSLREWAPVLLALIGNGLATAYTNVKKP